MAYTESNMFPLGSKAPNFSLLDMVSGKTITLSDIAGARATLVMFICNHCPYVIHVNPELVRLAKDYTGKGVGIVAISSNDVENYPQDSPEKMKETAAQAGYIFPYVFDETQEVAKSYDAACTPDFYLFDGDLKLVYRGRLDSSRPKNDIPVSGTDLRNALDAVLDGRQVDEKQYPSGGCNIKWKAG
jgi:peroxiredoxin